MVFLKNNIMNTHKPIHYCEKTNILLLNNFLVRKYFF